MIGGVGRADSPKENLMKIASRDNRIELDAGGLLDVSQDARDAQWPVEVMVTIGVHIALTGGGFEPDDEPSREAMRAMMSAAKTAVDEDTSETVVPFVVDGPDGAPLALIVLRAMSADIDPLFVVGVPSLAIAPPDQPIGRYVDCPACGALTLYVTDDGTDEPCDSCGGVETWER